MIRHCERELKQSIVVRSPARREGRLLRHGLLHRFAPRNDEVDVRKTVRFSSSRRAKPDNPLIEDFALTYKSLENCALVFAPDVERERIAGKYDARETAS